MATRSSAVTSQIVADGEYAARTLGYVWDPIGLAYVVATQSAGGGGGGAVTVADGADVAQGATTDAEAAAGNGSVVAILKRIRTLLSNPLAVTGTFFQATQPVSGTFFQATQPVSAAALPLPAGASTSALQTTGNNSLASIDTKIPALGQALAAASVPIVLTLAQIAAITPPAAIAGFALDATLTGGTQKAIVRGGAKGTTVAGDVTHTASGANHEGLDVILYDAAGNVINPTAIRALTVADVVSATQGTAAAVAGAWPVKHTDGTSTQAVKAASTAAVAADPAAVVALSPATGLPELRASTTVNSSTAAVNTALTATLAAAGAGLFHYITSIIVEKLYSVVGVAAGAGNIITSANLGGLGFTTEQLASVAGTVVRVVDYRPTTPLKSAVANTNSTIICGAQLQTIWRITVTYFIAP